MHWALLLVLNAAPPLKVATPGLTYVGIDAQLGGVYLDRFVSLLQDAGPIKVTTPRDMEQVLGLERQRQLMGCESSSSCLAELSGALGVDAVLGGSLAKTAAGYLVTLRAVRTTDGSEVATASGRFRDEVSLGDWLEAQGPAMAKRLLTAFGRAQDVTPVVTKPIEAPPGPSTPVVRWVPAGVGAIALAAGGVLWFQAKSAADQLGGDLSGLTTAEVHALANQGRFNQTAGPALVAVGVAGIAASILWMQLGASPATAAIAPVEGGGVVVVGGRF